MIPGLVRALKGGNLKGMQVDSPLTKALPRRAGHSAVGVRVLQQIISFLGKMPYESKKERTSRAVTRRLVL